MERGNFKQSHNIQEGNEYYSDAINNENHINEEDTLTKNKYESNNTNRRKINRKLKNQLSKKFENMQMSTSVQTNKEIQNLLEQHNNNSNNEQKKNDNS